MTTRLLVCLLLLGACLTVSTTALAQTEEDQVKAVLTSLASALAQGDSTAIGELVANSGFVALVGVMDQTMVLSKDEMLALMANSGVPVEFQDVKVSTHWMVALVSAKAVPAGVPVEGGFVLDAIMMREAGKWKFAAVCLCTEQAEASEEEVKAFVDRVATLPDSLKQGSAEALGQAIHDQRFMLALVDPSLEFRWATSKTALTQMLDSVIPMITVSESRLDVSKTVLGPSVAVVDGTWLLDITDFGETRTTLHVYAIKTNGEWKIVAIGGGPAK
ncbi:MAG: nuclear transport factor 2 family protein [Armatimonadetes bacterium]|nr:nuclear transport factor 2 family protein [Armatimonadota bacterium]